MKGGNKLVDFLIQLPFVNWLIHKSKTTTLPGFSGIPIYQVVSFFIRQVQTIGMTERASAIAFNFVMAIPPATIFLFTLIPYLPITQSLQQELYKLIKDIIPGERNNAVLINFLQDFINNPRNGLLSIGFILSLYFSSNAMMGIMRSFDKNYAGFKKRSNWQRRKAALRLTVLLYVFVMASLVALIAREVVLEWLGIENASLRALLSNLRWSVIFLLFFGCISSIYRLAPSVHKKWKLINPGSIVATSLMLITSGALSWWVANFSNYNQLYGSISTVLIIMILIFINSLILLIGFELNVSIYSLKSARADERLDAEN
ncbi:MAG: YihY/virulence factor BrkB family protein [Bacteroidota bacterium]|jgi:membrane protein|nr:YihY/virulence factor BrkB family protein [Terrimonas sp.]